MADKKSFDLGKRYRRDLDTFWLNLVGDPEGPGFELRFCNPMSPTYQVIRDKHTRKFKQEIRHNTLDAETDKRLGATVFVEACVNDWRNIVVDGENLGAFTPEKCVDLFLRFEEMFQEIINEAGSRPNFQTDDDVKN